MPRTRKTLGAVWEEPQRAWECNWTRPASSFGGVIRGQRKRWKRNRLEFRRGIMKLKNKGSNETEIRFKNGNVFFFSYDTPVAAYINRKYYKTSKYHSQTTSRHINRFLHGDTVNATQKPQFFFDEEMEKITRWKNYSYYSFYSLLV